MKIAFFTDTYHPSLNGVTVSLDHFSKALERKGHKVIIFAPRVKGYKETNPRVIRISSLKVLSSEPEVRMPIPTSAKDLKAIARQEFDIVHAHGNGPFSLLGYQIARIKGVPYVLTFHNFHTKYTHYFLEGKVVKPKMIAAGMRMFANICDGVIVPSRKMKIELKSYGVKKDISVIPNFVPFSNFSVKKTGLLHEKLNLDKKIPIVLSVGRLGKEKNFDFLIDVFSKVAEKADDVHFVIVGKGPEKDHLVELSKSLKLDRLHFLDDIPPNLMPQIYNDSHLFVFASDSEVHPMVALEAGLSGLPLVVCDDLAYENVAVNGENAYVLPQSSEIFSQSILKLLSDEKLRSEMSEKSRQIVKKNFDGDKITDDLIKIYEKLIMHQNKSQKILKKVNKITLARLMQFKLTLNKVLN